MNQAPDLIEPLANAGLIFCHRDEIGSSTAKPWGWYKTPRDSHIQFLFSYCFHEEEAYNSNQYFKGAPPLRSCAVVLLLLAVAASEAAQADVTVLDFEAFTDSTPLTTQYPGVTFSDATVISAGITLNEFELPPHAGTNVVFDDGGPMTINFATPVLSFGGYFTYYEPLTLQGFDSTDTEVASAQSLFSINVGCDPGPFCSGDPGSSPNEFIQVSSAAGISSFTMTADPNGSSFVLDDATYATASVPEPASVFLLLLILAWITIAHWRERSF